MLRMFTIKAIIKEYIYKGKDYCFPEPPFCRCHNPKCNRLVQFKKHGFYERSFVCSFFDGKIVVRRYICPLCGHTISLLPSFCLPRFIYAMEHILEYTYSAFHRRGTLRSCLDELNIAKGLNVSRQLVYKYRKRVLNTLNFLKLGIRQMDSAIALPNEEDSEIEKAKKVLSIVKKWPGPPNSFSQQFFEKNNKTIFAPNSN